MVSFRVGGEDANLLAAKYNPRFSERDIINLGVRNFYTKISIDGELREAFSGKTMFIETPTKNFAAECIKYSRQQYTRPVSEVQTILQQWEECVDTKAAEAGVLQEATDSFEAPLI